MAFSHVRPVVIDHTKCGSADSTNFPVLFSGTYSYLATVANSGLVTNASGFDIGFYADAALTTKLAWETELYTATTGQVIYWVKVPTLSHTTDTTIYLAYGDGSVSTDQSNKTGTWDSNFLGVYHFGTASTLAVTDSTGVNNGTNHSATATAQQVNGGAAFSGASQYISAGVTGYNVAQAQPLTIEGWLKTSAASNVGLGYLQVTTFAGYRLFTNGLTPGKAEFQMIGASGAIGALGGTTVTDGVRRRVTMVYSGSGAATGIQIYVNGTAETMTLANASATVGTVPQTEFDIGGVGAVGVYMTGEWDEVRVSKSARSSSYDLASYNNQSSPSTFYTIGGQLVSGTGTFAGTDSFTATGIRTVLGSGTNSNGGVLTATGKRTVFGGSVHLTGAGTFSATGKRTVLGTATHVGGGTFTASGKRTTFGTSTFVGAGTFTSSGKRITFGTASSSYGGTFAATGKRATFGTASLTATGTFTATGKRIVLAHASFTGNGQFVATGKRTTFGSASLGGNGIFVATGKRTVLGNASLTGNGLFIATGKRIVLGNASLTATGTFVAHGSRTTFGSSVVFVGGGTFVGFGGDTAPTIFGTGTFIGDGTFVIVYVNPAVHPWLLIAHERCEVTGSEPDRIASSEQTILGSETDHIITGTDKILIGKD